MSPFVNVVVVPSLLYAYHAAFMKTGAPLKIFATLAAIGYDTRSDGCLTVSCVEVFAAM